MTSIFIESERTGELEGKLSWLHVICTREGRRTERQKEPAIDPGSGSSVTPGAQVPFEDFLFLKWI